MKYAGKERRKGQRFQAKLIVSYRICDEDNNIDVSQSKNVGLGGMLLTTNKAFRPGTNLALTIRMPFASDPVNIIARVEDSKEVQKDEIFDTRLSFVSIDEKHKKFLLEALDYYKKKEGKNS